MRQPAELDLVTPDDYGIPSAHYYYLNRDRFDLNLEELAGVGVTDDKCRIGRILLEPLKVAQKEFERLGYKVIVKDGYRSPELYKMVHRKRLKRYGEEHTNKLMNVERMIHASGRVVDIDLVKLDGSTIRFRAAEDGIPAHIYGFYKDKDDPQSKEFQKNQDLMKDVMFGLGFEFGTLVEYWHFELPEKVK